MISKGTVRVTDPTSGWVFLHPVPGAKERWQQETSDKFEKGKLFLEGIHTLKSLLQMEIG